MSMVLFVSVGHAKTELMKTDSKSISVILDAGHGGVNPITNTYVTNGNRSPLWEDDTIYYEGVGNRDIVKHASILLLNKGIDTVFTVEPENYKDVALYKRVNTANKHYLNKNKKAILISVHSNGFRKESANGTEVFTSPGKTKSDTIATIWMEEFKSLFPEIKQRTDFDDNDIDKEAKYTIINDTICPAILVETMFHTNYKECKMLLDPKIRQRIALAICNTVEKVILKNIV